MPFILNALIKKFVHCFPAGNCSIIKYIRIPAGFQSDNWKTHLVFLFSIQFTPESDQKKKKKKITLLFYVRPSLLPMPQSWKLLQEKMKTNLQHLMVSKHGQRANRKREEMDKANNVLFSKFQFMYSCLNGQNGWFICIGQCEKKNWLSKFPQILADPSKMWRLEIIYSHTPFLELCQIKE